MEKIQQSILNELPALAQTDDRLAYFESLEICVTARLLYFLYVIVVSLMTDRALPHAVAVD